MTISGLSLGYRNLEGVVLLLATPFACVYVSFVYCSVLTDIHVHTFGPYKCHLQREIELPRADRVPC